MRRLIVFLPFIVISLLRAEPLPDLAQLKLAAESGDPVAQHEYGARIHQPEERLEWFMRSARQGYAPAQDGVAGLLENRYTSKPEEKKAFKREAVRWASRAAYQGVASAQGKLSEYYRVGAGVTKDPLKAYMWCQIAVQTSQAEGRPFSGTIAKANRDSLIRTTPSETIALGQRLAEGFQPTRFVGLNPVEADLVFAELNLSSIFRINGNALAVLNGVRFAASETKELNVDGARVKLTCLAIKPKAAAFAIAGTDYKTVLQLKH